MALNDGYLTIPVDMDRICRICLQQNTKLSSIFLNEQYPNLHQKVQTCGAIECHEQDGLPSLICDVCIYKAGIAHEFRQLCQDSDNRLRLYYHKPSKLNDSWTQTDCGTQVFITQNAEDLQGTYFVKNEAINNQQFHSAIQGENFDPDTQNPVAVEANIPTVSVDIPVQGGQTFVCELSYDHQSKNVSGSQMVPSRALESVPYSAEIISVSENLIHNVCTVQTDNLSSTDHHDCKNISYFNFSEKDETIQDENDDYQDQIPDADSISSHVEPVDQESQSNNYSESNSNICEQEENSESLLFQCEICSKLCSTEEELMKHQQIHNLGLQCKICSKIFDEPDEFQEHENTHTEEKYNCHVCHMSFSKSSCLQKHMNSHKEASEPEFISPHSPELAEDDSQSDEVKPEFDYDRLDVSDDESFKSTPKVFKCEQCGLHCSTPKILRRHIKTHGEKKYSCPICKKLYFRSDILKKHVEKHGPGLLDNPEVEKIKGSDEDSFSSDFANSVLYSDDSQKAETEGGAEGNGQYQCEYCGKKVSTRKGLSRHVALHKPKPEPVTCVTCNKTCATSARLILHQKTHAKPKEKPPREYLCHICSRVYPSNSSLTYHMRTHTGVKPHVCKICNSGFTTTTSLANHVRIHTGDKPFVCQTCSAAFAVSSAFKRHLTRHTGEANYLCKTCGKAFKRLSTLKEHTYTHSGEKPFVCKTCGAAYSHSGSLFAHQKRCKAQCTEAVAVDQPHNVAQHVHGVNNVQSEVRPLTVIGQIF